jgi:hypothetical protein
VCDQIHHVCSRRRLWRCLTPRRTWREMDHRNRSTSAQPQQRHQPRSPLRQVEQRIARARRECCDDLESNRRS